LRVLEFAVRLPPEQSLDKGWTRAIMRRAMKGITPEKVRVRTDKASLKSVVMKQINFKGQGRLQKLFRDPGPIRRYVNLDQYQELYRRRHQLNSRGGWRITFLANLAYWLRTGKQKE